METDEFLYRNMKENIDHYIKVRIQHEDEKKDFKKYITEKWRKEDEDAIKKARDIGNSDGKRHNKTPKRVPETPEKTA